MSTDATISLLKRVPLLAGVSEQALGSLVGEGQIKCYRSGARVLVELEPGDKLLIILAGRGQVTVGGYGGEPPMPMAEVGPGGVLGEVTVLTGELRSATVIASEPMEVLAVSSESFARLIARFPCVAIHCYHLLAGRLRETEEILEKVLDPASTKEEKGTALLRAPTLTGRVSRIPFLRGVVKGYRELVKGHGQDLAFLMLVSFAASLILTRCGISTVRWLGFPLSGALKATYVVGLVILCVSALCALNVRRPTALRTLASLFGAGMAMLLNGMSALMAFDIFYKHDGSPDPGFQFSIDMLYDRGEGPILLAAVAAFLVQAAFLRRFYVRIAYQILARLHGRRQ